MVFNCKYIGSSNTSDPSSPSDPSTPSTPSGPSPTLDDNTPEVIQEVAAAGTAKNYWSVGDKIGIALNGTVGVLKLADTYYAFIIGFDHNSEIEGSNTIHFQFGKTADNTRIAFVDYAYNNSNFYDSNKFVMNYPKTNSGGWASSIMRTKRCAEFLAALPTNWQDVIQPCTKYSDNTGGGSNKSSYVTATSDKIWLLSEVEITGMRSMSNSGEKKYQERYEYYAAGNSRIMHRHSDTSKAAIWWLRSVYASNKYSFLNVTGTYKASVAASYSHASFGFAPGFMVA